MPTGWKMSSAADTPGRFCSDVCHFFGEFSLTSNGHSEHASITALFVIMIICSQSCHFHQIFHFMRAGSSTLFICNLLCLALWLAHSRLPTNACQGNERGNAYGNALKISKALTNLREYEIIFITTDSEKRIWKVQCPTER